MGITRRSRLAKIASLLSSLHGGGEASQHGNLSLQGCHAPGHAPSHIRGSFSLGGESGSQIESRPSSFLAAARDGVRSIMKRATGDEENNGKKKKMGNSKSKKGRGKKREKSKKEEKSNKKEKREE